MLIYLVSFVPAIDNMEVQQEMFTVTSFELPQYHFVSARVVSQRKIRTKISRGILMFPLFLGFFGVINQL